MSKKLAFGLAATAAILLVGSTGAFSSVSAERGINVAVVDDENAYMGIESGEEVEQSGNDSYSATYLTVRNGFQVPVNATVSVKSSSSDNLSVDLDSGGEWEGQLQPASASGAASEDLGAQFTCTGVNHDAWARLTYTVTFDGDIVHAVSGPRSVEFDVECPA